MFDFGRQYAGLKRHVAAAAIDGDVVRDAVATGDGC
jgi:hypothetical protein